MNAAPLKGKGSGAVVIHTNITDRKLAELAVQASETTVRALLDASTQAILAIGEDRKIVLMNAHTEKMFGCSREDLIGRDLEVLVPESIRGRHAGFHQGYFADMRNRPMGIGLDLEARRKDGALFPVEIGLGAIDSDGRRLAVAFVTDITPRKEAEQALRHSELRYRALFEHMNEGVAYCRMIVENGVGTDYTCLAVNKRFEELTGLKDVAGKNVTESLPNIRQTDPDVLERYARVAQTGTPETFETFINAVGRWYSISAYSPEKGYFVAVFDDITARRTMEETLRQSEERMRLAVESTGVGTFDFDVRTQRRIWSDVARSYFGLPPDASVDEAAVREIIHPDDRDRVRRNLKAAMRPGSGGHYTSKFRTTAPNGPVRWVSEWGRVLFDRSGQPERMVGVLLDITERKRLADAAEASANDLPEYLRTGAGHEAADARELSGEGCTLAAQERALLLRALEAAQGNRSKAARTLQMGRNAFRYKLRKYALEAPEPGSAFAAAG